MVHRTAISCGLTVTNCELPAVLPIGCPVPLCAIEEIRRKLVCFNSSVLKIVVYKSSLFAHIYMGVSDCIMRMQTNQCSSRNLTHMGLLLFIRSRELKDRK